MTTFTSTLTGAGFGGLNLRLPLATWIRVARERRALGAMSDQRLRDMGIDAAAAEAEAARPFWDIPAGR